MSLPLPPGIAEIPGLVVDGAATVGNVVGDAAGFVGGAVNVVGAGVGVAGDVVGLVPGGFATVGIVAIAGLCYVTFRGLFPAARVATVEAAANYVDTRQPGAGRHVRSAARQPRTRRETAARDAVRSRSQASAWGSGTQAHVAAPGKCPIIDRVDDRQGRPRRLVVCAPSQADADRRIRRSFVAGFRCSGEPGPCDEHDHRYHFTFAAAQQQTAQRRRSTGKGSK